MFEKLLVQIFVEFQRSGVWLSSEYQSKTLLLEKEAIILFPPGINPVKLSTPSGSKEFADLRASFSCWFCLVRGTETEGKGANCGLLLPS